MSRGEPVYKRCKCRGADDKDLGANCPKLKRADNSWNPKHGTWYFALELPPGPNKKRRPRMRRGGFETREAAIEAREKRLNPRYKQWSAPTSAKKMVLDLARQHELSYVRTQDDALADVITGLTGDVVVTDEIEDLIVALKRAGAIDEKTMIELLGSYLVEKESI